MLMFSCRLGSLARWRSQQQCGPNDEFAHIRDFAAKAAEHAARMAGVLTIVENLHRNEIGVGAMRNAIELADWYVNEACRLQHAGLIDPKLHRAAALLEWLQAQPTGEISFREILQFGPNATRTKASAEEALKKLANHGWVVEVSARPRVIRALRQGQ